MYVYYNDLSTLSTFFFIFPNFYSRVFEFWINKFLYIDNLDLIFSIFMPITNLEYNFLAI